MTRRPPLFRAFWLACAVVQLGLPATAALADAIVEAGAARAQVHIESQATDACPRLHPPDCALCRFLSAPAATSHGSTVAIAATDRAAGASLPAAFVAARAVPLPQSRAPPSLS